MSQLGGAESAESKGRSAGRFSARRYGHPRIGGIVYGAVYIARERLPTQRRKSAASRVACSACSGEADGTRTRLVPRTSGGQVESTGGPINPKSGHQQGLAAAEDPGERTEAGHTEATSGQTECATYVQRDVPDEILELVQNWHALPAPAQAAILGVLRSV